MAFGIKSLDNLPQVHKDKIASISDERSLGDGFWIYLKDEYADLNHDPLWNCRSIHEQTIGGCIARLKASELLTPENSNEPLFEGMVVNENRFKEQ